MATMVPEDDIVAAPKKRALPFKRTVARKQRSSEEPKKPEEDNDLDLFRHSKEVFPEVLREAQEAEEEKDQSQNDRKRRKISSSSSSDPTHSRKRSPTDGSDDDLIMDVKGKGKEIIRPRRLSTPPGPSSAQSILRTPSSNRASPKTPVSRRTRSKKGTGSPELPVTIPDDSDSDAKPTTSLSQQNDDPTNPSTPARPVSPPPAEASSSSPIEVLANPFSDPNTKEPKPDDFSEWVTKARALQAADSQKTPVNIFITSRLPHCEKPVAARRRLNQGVQLLLDVWISQKEDSLRMLDPAVTEAAAASRFFLTWKGNKIYGHSTLASLGVQVDARGVLRGAHGEGYVRDGLHLEVWTEEAYAEYLENRGKEWALKLGEGEEEDGDGMDGVYGRGGGSGAGGEGGEVSSSAGAVPKKKGIRIVLKAKEHEALKLTTREETDVEMLIEAFRTQRDIGPEWSVAIYFDGERLEEDALVSEIDIDPDDVNQMEVHVKKA